MKNEEWIELTSDSLIDVYHIDVYTISEIGTPLLQCQDLDYELVERDHSLFIRWLWDHKAAGWCALEASAGGYRLIYVSPGVKVSSLAGLIPRK